MENEKDIMMKVREKKRGEEIHIGERRESNKSRITKVPLSAIYTHIAQVQLLRDRETCAIPISQSN